MTSTGTEVINLNEAVVVVREGERPAAESMTPRILVEEVEKRTSIRLKILSIWPEAKPVIAITTRDNVALADHKIPNSKRPSITDEKPEGYRLLLQRDQRDDQAQPVVWIIGNDSRGALYGTGHLLRVLELTQGSVMLPDPIDVTTTPAYPIRGHQLAYRNTANTYDAWSPEQYEQYIRELVIFGTNCIENVPFQDTDSVHMKIPRREMDVKLSQICENYDIDYWLFVPAEFDLSDKERRDVELAKHEKLFHQCPRINGIFLPGGDPGDNHPKLVMPFLEDLSKRLKTHHPDAGTWVSLQQFDREEIDYFFKYLEERKPDWLTGVVAGPSSPSITMTRDRLHKKYRLRHYPDITHTIRCQYEIEWWDQAFALTLGREPCNPQPEYYARIHNHYAPYTDGFLSYSDGAHDDVNKTVWTRLSWDPHASTREIILEYCHFFFSPEVAEPAAEGILALEKNWVGPLNLNESVEATLAHWRNLEHKAPHLAGNWRWQFCLLRAYYDAYTRRRLLHEQSLEQEAMEALADANSQNIERTMDVALEIVKRADTEPFCEDLRNRIEYLCEALFQSIGLQSSVPRYQARGPERGCVLDFVDYPLNNRWWLEDEFAKIREIETEEEKLARLEIIRTWENPGSGSFYDDIGNLANSPRIQKGWIITPGYAWWDGGYSRARLSSQVYMVSPKLRYENLDPEAEYTVRVAGYGEALLEINSERIPPTVYNKGEGEFKEFPVPKHLTKDRAIMVTFARPDEKHLNWRHRSRISDVWLLKT